MLYAHDVFHDIIEGVLLKFLAGQEMVQKNWPKEIEGQINSFKWKNCRMKEINLAKCGFSCSSGMQVYEFFIQFSLIDFKMFTRFMIYNFKVPA